MKLPKGERDLQCLGIFVHGVLASLHALGLLYNLRRRNWLDASMHSAAAAYDLWATSQHMAAVRRLSYDEYEPAGSAIADALSVLPVPVRKTA